MPPPHPYQRISDHFAYTGPEPKCDCDLLQTEYCCQHEDLVHTRLVDQQRLDISLDDDRQSASYVIEIRQCPTCALFWWMHMHSVTHHTHERDSEVVIGSVTTGISAAVRCPDRQSAEELTQWFPRHLDARARCERIHRSRGNNLFGAVRACADLAALNSRTQILAASSALPRASNSTRGRHGARMQSCIASLETDPGNVAAWEELQKLQRWCRGERLLDPAVTAENWTAEELWTPALAGVRQLETRIWDARNAATGKKVGSSEHAELRRIEDAIASARSKHMRVMDWPSPEVEFHCLIEHAKLLRPEIIRGDTASWVHPKEVCQRIYWLISRLGVKPSWRIAVPAWIAERTGLPDGRKRTHENACRDALLRKRRAARQQNAT